MNGAGSDEEKRQRWRMIASLLGAPVRDEPEPAPAAEVTDEPAASALEASTGTRPPRGPRPKSPRTSRAPGDWHTLRAQLGIEPPPAPAAPPEPTSRGAHGAGDESGEAVSEFAATAAPDAGEAWEAAEAGEPLDMVDHVSGDTVPAYFDPDAASLDDALEDDEDLLRAGRHESDAELGRREEQGAGSDSDESVDRKRRRRRKRRGGARSREEADAKADGRLAADENLTDDDVREAARLEEDDDESEHPRGRRAPRRERRDGEGAQDAESVVELDFEEDDSDEEEAVRYRGHAADEDDEEDGEDAAEGEGRAKHKKIPTWEETIGVIVASNLDLRRREGNSKHRPPRGRRRGGRNGNDRR